MAPHVHEALLADRSCARLPRISILSQKIRRAGTMKIQVCRSSSVQWIERLHLR